MAQDDTGLRKLLTFPLLYSLFQQAVGATQSRRWLLREGWRVRPGMRIVDIGCGPGDILDELPTVHYVGLDVSEEYIRAARARYVNRGIFIAGTAPALLGVTEAQGAELVTCTGVLHHLSDDEVLELLDVAHRLLAPGGRFVALEPVFLRHQSRFATWVMRKDRGQNIRSEQGWKRLLRRSEFGQIETFVTAALIRIPYNHVLIEAYKTE